MRDIDLVDHPRIGTLTAVMREISTLTEPAEMIRAFAPWVSTRMKRDYFVSVSKRNMPEGTYKLTRVIPGAPSFETVQAAPPVNPWQSWDEIPTHEGGIIGDILRVGEPRVIEQLDLASDPVLSPVMGEEAARMRTLAAMPAYDNGEPLNWSISFSADPDWDSVGQFESGMLDINLMGTATRNLVVRKHVQELNDRLSAQLEQIARIQRAMLPEKSPEVPGFEVATSYITSDDSGGDYYDFYNFPDGRFGVLIADVSGHGAGAATVVAMLRAIIHCYESEEGDPARFANFCNEKLGAARLSGNFITAFFCVIDPGTGRIVWSRAGHNPPRIRRADGTIDVIDSAGTLPLGIIDDLNATSDAGQLGVGDTLVLYTDGITELRNKDDELFGEERMDAALQECTGKPECVVDSIHQTMFGFTGSMTRQDDQTLVVVRRTGAP
ncbi:MAG: PP2C family protein-serine/threonine phosphatase [Planctomycetota bacterium]